MLAARTNAALGRFATLQRRAEAASLTTAPVLKPALRELSEALEELRVANEQLQQHAEEVAGARARLERLALQVDEFAEVLPLACVRTNAHGEIDTANSAAASLLNVSGAHLRGRSLLVFVLERQKFLDAQSALTDGLTTSVEVASGLRPREKRPRPMRLLGRRLQHDDRYAWFLVEPPSQDE
jgi:PAS domain-containing protein